MRIAGLVGVVVLLVGCGGEAAPAAERPDGGEVATPLRCEHAAREGSYRVTYKLVSGNCGELAAQTSGAGDDSLGTACTPIAQTWSADGCTLTSRVDCGQWLVSSVTTATPDARTVTGTATFDVTPPSACTGTYAIVATRP